MGTSYTTESLIHYARTIELYGWREKIVERLVDGNFDAALFFCHQAITDGQMMKGRGRLATPAVNTEDVERKIKRLIVMIGLLRQRVTAAAT